MSGELKAFAEALAEVESQLEELQGNDSEFARLRKITLHDRASDCLYSLAAILRDEGRPEWFRIHDAANAHWSYVTAAANELDKSQTDPEESE